MASQIDMQVVRVYRFENGNSKLKAFADVAIGQLVVKGFRILEGKEGLYMGMPRQQGKDGRWHNSSYSKSPELRKALSDIIFAAYNENTMV